MKTELWQGTEALIERAELWDDLWDRSDVTAPTNRAALVRSFINTFADAATFRAVVAWEDDRLVAAIPLVFKRRARLLHCYELPANDWTTGCAALIDRDLARAAARCEPLAARLVEQLGELSWRALLLDGLAGHHPLWDSLIAVMKRRGWFATWEQRRTIAWLPIERFTGSTLSHLSKNTRKNFRRAERQLEEKGCVSLRVLTPARFGAVEAAAVEQALEIEHNKSDRPGWTSIRSAGLAGFYREQAALATQGRQFMLSFLELDGEPIAFEYGWLAKRTYHSLKVGYDPDFRSQAPGHLLMWKLSEYLAARGDVDRIDCLCATDTALARTWRCEGYPTYRLWACRPAWLGQTIAWGLRQKNGATAVSPTSAGVPAATPAPV